MFLHDTAVWGLVSLVQDGQFVSGKGNHVSAQVQVPLMKRGLSEAFGRSSRRHRTASGTRGHSRSGTLQGGLQEESAHGLLVLFLDLDFSFERYFVVGCRLRFLITIALELPVAISVI